MSGAPITSQRFEENRHKFRDYVFARTAHNYKFWIVSSKLPSVGAGRCVAQYSDSVHACVGAGRCVVQYSDSVHACVGAGRCVVQYSDSVHACVGNKVAVLIYTAVSSICPHSLLCAVGP